MRQAAWKASSASASLASTPPQTSRTIGPWRHSRAWKAAWSWWAWNRWRSSWSGSSRTRRSSPARRMSCKIGFDTVLTITRFPSTEAVLHLYSSWRQGDVPDYFQRNAPFALHIDKVAGPVVLVGGAGTG